MQQNSGAQSTTPRPMLWKTTRSALSLLAHSIFYQLLGFTVRHANGYQYWRSHRDKPISIRVSFHSEWIRKKKLAMVRRLFFGLGKPTVWQQLQAGINSLWLQQLRKHSPPNKEPHNAQALASAPLRVQISTMLLRRLDHRLVTQPTQQAGPDLTGITTSVLVNHTANSAAVFSTSYASFLLRAEQAVGRITLISSTQRTDRFSQSPSWASELIPCSMTQLAATHNQIATQSNTKYLAFINSNFKPHENALLELLYTMETIPDAGMACAVACEGNLFMGLGHNTLPKGTVVEQAVFGALEWPEFSCIQDVDACSPYCCVVPRSLFIECGGLTGSAANLHESLENLCMMIRENGKRVLAVPFATGQLETSIPPGSSIPLYIESMEPDQRLCALRFKDTSDTLHPPETNKQQHRNALVIDLSIPTPDRDSGSIDAVNLLRILDSIKYRPVFIPHDLKHLENYDAALQRMGVRIFSSPYIKSVNQHLQMYGHQYDLVILRRVRVATAHIKDVRRYCENAVIIFDTVDLHFLREERQALIEESADTLKRAKKTKQAELAAISLADATIVISDTELAALKEEKPRKNIVSIPYARTISPTLNKFDDRAGIVFVGGFQHAPNVDAIEYFVRDIWPLICKRVPGITFHIVGSDAPAHIASLSAQPGIVVEGFVPDLSSILDRCRLTIAPMRFGAGIKGKIGSSLSHGVPCVATEVAAEGMPLENGQNILIGNTPADFSDAVVRLYSDEELWKRLALNGLSTMQCNYSIEGVRARYEDLIEAAHATKNGNPLMVLPKMEYRRR